VLSATEADKTLCPLPEFDAKLFDYKARCQPPWWLKSYVPAAYQGKIPFTEQKPGEKPPEATNAPFADLGELLGKRVNRPAAALGSSAPSVVVLPPRLPEAANSSVRAVAELVCDRLAEELAAAGVARVLDRSQIARVLEEKQLGGGGGKPVTAYDALVRLEVDVPSLAPEVRMSLIDLSHGNVMKQERCAWPMREDDLQRMVNQCGEGLKDVGRAEKGKVKVRCLEAENEEQNPRMELLVRRLERLFEQAVARSPQRSPVRHLEAASAKEESLLLLLGLSRLPGERQFVPQADATVELSVREGNGRGKTFEETPVEITVRVIRGDTGANQSFATTATVGRFDAAAAASWEKLAGFLREARPDAAANWLDDMAARRRQAEAELRTARSLHSTEWGPVTYEQLAHDRLAHLEAALKLDPTLEDAIGERFESLANECAFASAKHEWKKTLDFCESILSDGLRYFDRYGTQGKYRETAQRASRCAVDQALGVLDFYAGMALGHQGAPLTASDQGLTPQQLRIVPMAKRVLEEALVPGERRRGGGLMYSPGDQIALSRADGRPVP
jgi:hypothetical protein